VKPTTIIATALLLLAVSPGLRAQDPTDLEDVVLYTNADVEKLEPLPTGQPLVDTSFDTEAWEFVSAFIASERAKITSDRDHELERDRVEIEADRPVGYGERYPYYALRVPYGRARHGKRDGGLPAAGNNAAPATGVPHPMFRSRPPVREFTRGLGNSYRGAKSK
jgi:hypothetical protein